MSRRTIDNVIFILCDTLTRDKLEPYQDRSGPYSHIDTPHIQRLAERGCTFTNHWINSAPCMPARRDLCSGRIEFPWRSWGPRESFDPDWALQLRDTGITTCLFTDHANLFDAGAGNYHHWYDYYNFVRGHLNDHATTCLPVQPGRKGLNRQQYASQQILCEEQSFVARNLTNVVDWLDTYGRTGHPFFMMVDEFDPHWPLDPPEPYRSRYVQDRGLLDQHLSTCFDRGGRAERYSPDEIAWLQAQCAGKISMVDHWLGKVWDRLDALDLWDSTLVILTTDHGEYIGEHGLMSKGSSFSYPTFARIPLIVCQPEEMNPGSRCDALTCTVDLHATVLDALGQAIHPSSHSRSIMPLLRDTQQAIRQDLIYGWWGKGFYWTDGRSLLCKAPKQPGPLYQYGCNFGDKYVGLAASYFDRYAGAEVGAYLPHTTQPVYRVPSDGMAYNAPHADYDALYDLVADPGCSTNCFGSPATADCLRALADHMRELSVPDEQFSRLGLDSR